ncbi:MAG: 3-isopropylmalate dehydratase small subunit [Anaerolineaceae bacterium]|nr:3-isopropylmalate dehydratase small subunit [Anaerolineaceae bacterium]
MVMDNIKGRVWKYGDDVNTDVIFPGKYTYTVSEPSEMPKHALEDLDPEFAKKVQRGDIIVGGKNWGCGSSREQAVVCLKESGVGAIVARSFARIYYRNCINNALPAITCPEVVDAVESGEIISVDLIQGEVLCSKGSFAFPPIPDAVMGIFEAGGLIQYTRMKLNQNHR